MFLIETGFSISIVWKKEAFLYGSNMEFPSTFLTGLANLIHDKTRGDVNSALPESMR